MIRMLFAVACVIAYAAPTLAGEYQSQLRRECDALLETAIRRPYGMGFDPSGRGDTRKPTTRPVSFEPLQTPAAGIVLLWSGRLLDEPKYIIAAQEISKATISAQAVTGQVPAITIFAGRPAGRDDAQLYPSRTATIASLGLLLATMGEAENPDARIKGAVQRAIHWIVKQRTGLGAWPSAAQMNPDDKEQHRIIRLDESDFRNAVFAMLVISELLDDAEIRKAAIKSLDHLLSLRIRAMKLEAESLWCGVYDLQGQTAPLKIGLPESPDLSASRHAMQTLLAGYLITGDRRYGQAVDEAFKSLDELQLNENIWRRFPDAKEGESSAPIFGTPGVTESGPLGLPGVRASMRQMKLQGRDKFVQMLSVQFTPRQHLIAAMVGLTDEPLHVELPAASGEVDAYLKSHAEKFAIIQGSTPELLDAKVKRLWVLLIRAKLERLTEK